ADAPPMRVGDNGFSVKAPDSRHASYYYSLPQLTVSGSVTLAGRQQPVTGTAWLDHEWSSELMPATAQGWDWVGLNFDDCSALMAFRMRDHQNAPLWATASLRAPGGEVRTLPPSAVVFTPLRSWRSPRTNIDYPVEWRLRVDDRELLLQPLLDDQELDSRRSTGAVYWEGAVRVREGGKEIGRGYLEMTGYGEKLRVGSSIGMESQPANGRAIA
ncbi:MAG: lipocalin family protein, partial [Propionivibrio sp.]